MTEYWQSKKQYWCKYCSIFIRDDAPSRRQHEQGLRHQGNRDRFVRDIYKSKEKGIKEREEEKRIMQQIEKDAQAAEAAANHSPVIISAPVHSSSPSGSASPGPSRTKPPATAATNDKWANYTTAAQLGYFDAEAQWKAQMEEEKEKRAKVGEAGNWQTVAISTPTPPPYADAQPDGNTEQEPRNDATEQDERFRTRPAEIQGSLDVRDGDEEHNFRFTRKPPHHDPYDDDDYDPSILLKNKGKGKVKDEEGLKVKVKEETIKEREEREKREKEEKGALGSGRLDREGWKGLIIGKNGTASELVKTEDEPETDGKGVGENGHEEAAKQEETVNGEEETEQKPSSGGGMFKKRKAPSSATRSVRQKT